MNIPDKCYALNLTTINPKTEKGEVIEIRALEKGYYKTLHQNMTQSEVDNLNATLGVDKATAYAMTESSMWGWEGYTRWLRQYTKYFSKP